ncbi:aminoacyl-tRNA hydrolase [Pleomorphomonas diazotrophica]|uniref:Peptidyl-tRNA hydrolase n=1 Tax=Pleomorphomonas diazotrophica TaxID=1166257 RepID=A0A1I4W131_9HYPH|nr:aminoacyl-tRNA hydrolase [Pleomorphomonas diazotrophica]PKR88237.1 aminoacyl-tRNA hydrolase [Pleomorphomonas diazotrophica]SFN06946.1 peptidyl-tRNA hydrolase [Pleomorphomonas diazotrophica]
MLILVGLGNPGAKYASNRHNIGFMAADVIHTRHRFPAWRKNFQAEVSEGTIDGERVLLMKPQTYMNESGRSVGDAVRFLKLAPSDVVVIHDELDLPPGKLRMKVGGGHGGHNGLRSITSQITDGYRRMRLGIGHPGDKALVHAHVLSDFAKADRDWLVKLLDAIADNAGELVKGADATFANRVHAITEPKPERKPKTEAKTDNEPAAPAAAAPAEPPPKNAMAAILKGLLAQKTRR